MHMSHLPPSAAAEWAESPDTLVYLDRRPR